METSAYPIFDCYRHTLRAQISLGPRSSAIFVCGSRERFSIPSFSPKGREIWDSCKYIQARFLKPDALEALSTAKVLLLKKIFFVLDHVKYAVNPLLSPPLNL